MREDIQYVAIDTDIFYTETGDIKDLKGIRRGWSSTVDYAWLVERPGVLHADGKDIEINESSIIIKTYPVKDYSKRGSASTVIPARYIVIPAVDLVLARNEMEETREKLENSHPNCDEGTCCECATCKVVG